MTHGKYKPIRTATPWDVCFVDLVKANVRLLLHLHTYIKNLTPVKSIIHPLPPHFVWTWDNFSGGNKIYPIEYPPAGKIPAADIENRKTSSPPSKHSSPHRFLLSNSLPLESELVLQRTGPASQSRDKDSEGHQPEHGPQSLICTLHPPHEPLFHLFLAPFPLFGPVWKKRLPFVIRPSLSGSFVYFSPLLTPSRTRVYTVVAKLNVTGVTAVGTSL